MAIRPTTKVSYNRLKLPIVLTELNLIGYGVEVGVWQGHYSHHILSTWPGFMYLVDPWRGNLYNYVDIRNEPQWIVEGYFNTTVQKLLPFAGRYEIMRMMSHEAVHHIPDGHLDWVYLDANHTYPYVTQDLEVWWPKLKDGGMMSGHDFVDGENLSGSDFGVASAVSDFMAKEAPDAELFVLDEDWQSWYFIK